MTAHTIFHPYEDEDGHTDTHKHTPLHTHFYALRVGGLCPCLVSSGQFLTLVTGSHTSLLIINLQ